MNERIRQLAEQAGFEITPWGDELLPCVHQEGPIYEELEKFAELIVRECMKVSNLSLSKHELPSDKIAEHFGVKL